MVARRIALRLTRADGRTLTRSQTLEAPLHEAGEILAEARNLLGRFAPDLDALRSAALVVKGLEMAGVEERQLDLF